MASFPLRKSCSSHLTNLKLRELVKETKPIYKPEPESSLGSAHQLVDCDCSRQLLQIEIEREFSNALSHLKLYLNLPHRLLQPPVC